ncbi:MAG TPA: LytTR family DNA-binding domain-containing protein [Sphingomicrobium sp.]|nr:LytTR family DNA-binding domain-containing protein [Sphingomicrobium sp.]
MRVLIVDDEPLARRGVALRLKEWPDIEIVGECEDGSLAVQRIIDLSPDLIFLDVQMPDMDGFEVLRALPRDKLPNVIFLTAYEEHALDAFRVHAVDYLLKPFSRDRFAAAVDRARTQMEKASKVELATRMLQLLGREEVKQALRFVVKSGSRIQFIEESDIDWVSAAGDYAELHVDGTVHLLRETMTALEAKLDPARFARIHRSRIVNLSRIVEMRTVGNGEYVVTLRDSTQHRSSRTRTDKLERWLER